MSQHILIVDDDPDIRAVVVQCLLDDGFQVATASNGREALDLIATDPPSALLLDMRMPVLDGWSVARALRGHDVRPPIIVMTAAQDARRWAAEIEADAYLSKPFDLDELVATVARFASPESQA